MKNKITLLNIISTIVLQVVTIISFFIIPKIILSYFGSNVNGLVSSIEQFLNYITLIEGGITGVISASLYKPLIEKNENKINAILNTAKEFYKKIGLIFIIYSLILAIIYPLLFKTEFSFLYVSILVIILAIKLFVQYMFSVTYKTLLNSDKKVYIVSISQTIMIIINVLLSIISVKIYPSIHLLKVITGILYLMQPIVYNYYVNKYFKINKDVKKDTLLLKQRWNGFSVNLAAFIHLSTDISILTIFTDFATVSVYSVYSLVTNGIKQMINAVSRAIVPTIGQAYASGNNKDINMKMDLYEYIIFILVFVTCSVAGFLITPFVMLYTKGINDANYYQPLFGILILLSEALYLIKFPHLELSYSANKFKEITKPAFIEAAINIIISIILVNKYGLIGIAIGTIVAMLYRMAFHIYFTSKLIDNRKQNIFYRKLIIFSTGCLIGILICNIIPCFELTVVNWIINAIIYSVIFGIIYILISIIFFRKEINYLKKYLRKGK